MRSVRSNSVFFALAFLLSPPAWAHFSTLPPGSLLPNEANCASQLHGAAENRPDNTDANQNVPSLSQLKTYQSAVAGGEAGAPAHFLTRVDGEFTGTTDEIIQWAACKWGIDEDVVRAIAVNESRWHQNAAGEWTENTSQCPSSGAVTNGGRCAQSYGIVQTKFSTFPSAWPLSRTSTAFSLDYKLAQLRACFEGKTSYLQDWGSYQNGEPSFMLWGCIGNGYSGGWYDPGAQGYINEVQSYYNAKPWLNPTF